jgi:hypothetical protein
MFQPQTTIAWGGALLWLLGIAAAAFLVSWILTDRLHLRRTPYVGALAALTAALTGGYLTWSGAGAAFWTTRWPWGLLGAALVGALLARLVSRLPAAHPPAGVRGVAAAWVLRHGRRATGATGWRKASSSATPASTTP